MAGAAVISDSAMPSAEVVHVLTAEFLSPGEVAALLGTTRKALADWRLKRQGPPFMLRAQGVVVYPAESFKSYLRARLQKDSREGVERREARWSRAAVRPNLAVNVSH
jgi:hypothetical protein